MSTSNQRKRKFLQNSSAVICQRETLFSSKWRLIWPPLILVSSKSWKFELTGSYVNIKYKDLAEVSLESFNLLNVLCIKLSKWSELAPDNHWLCPNLVRRASSSSQATNLRSLPLQQSIFFHSPWWINSSSRQMTQKCGCKIKLSCAFWKRHWSDCFLDTFLWMRVKIFHFTKNLN